MNLLDKIRYVEIHPFKISADIFGGIIGIYLLWQHYLILALSITYLPSFATGFLLMKYVNLEKYKNSKAGRYIKDKSLLFEMISFMGQAVIGLGAWYHNMSVIVIGAFTIGFSYSHGLFKKQKVY